MKIGIIGCGERVGMLMVNFFQLTSDIVISGIFDINHERSRFYLEQEKVDYSSAKWYCNVDEMLNDQSYDGIIIGTRCDTHTSYAIKVLSYNIPLFLEKPVGTSLQELLELKSAGEASSSEVVVSFPLRNTPVLQRAKKMLDSGLIGKVEHVQAVNNVTYGRVYYKNWYRNEGVTGGLWLQKATHDFDAINYLLETKAIEICAMKSKQLFKGNKPKGLKCSQCEEKDTCPESAHLIKYLYGDLRLNDIYGDECSFAVDTGNEDSGSAIIRYESGMHVCYSQNFFVRKKAGNRSIRLMGFKGTIEFDWYTNELNVFMHQDFDSAKYKFDISTLTHGGGDLILAQNFINIMRKKENSIAPLMDGIWSALMCIKANESCQDNCFKRIEF